MKTAVFTKLIEQAIVEIYGSENESNFDTVPFIDDGQSEKARWCIGIFINDVVHMAGVAAHAQFLLHKRMDSSDEASVAQIREDMEDFCLLMQLFRVAPYMQWTCIYFPGLTMDDENTDGLTEEKDAQGD